MNPRLTFSYISAAFLTLAATGLALNAGPAVAQQADEVMEEVVVEAPITVRKVSRANIPAKIELIELKRRVSYSDLDLSKYADVIELEARVEAIAKESCESLSTMFPLDSTVDKRRCVRDAIRSAENQVQAAIEIAGS